jgi:hypothetical protein
LAGATACTYCAYDMSAYGYTACVAPTALPSPNPSVPPSQMPTAPTAVPSWSPTATPSVPPSLVPTTVPTAIPTKLPSSRPSCMPSTQPTLQPSVQPSRQPTGMPTAQPYLQPSTRPTGLPSSQPSGKPSSKPSHQPSMQPTGQPITAPTSQPTSQPSELPTRQPTSQPTAAPTVSPTTNPTRFPTAAPSICPTSQPSEQPSGQPSLLPTAIPSSLPSFQPTVRPSGMPSGLPTASPSRQPSSRPTLLPTSVPTMQPTGSPSSQPFALPSSPPSCYPSTQPSLNPSSIPTMLPSCAPSRMPTGYPSCQPTSRPSTWPTRAPSSVPSVEPSCQPISDPSSSPTSVPTAIPSWSPSASPSRKPSRQPVATPSSVPSAQPSMRPSSQPSKIPTANPTRQPTSRPSQGPTTRPSSNPSSSPTTRPTSQPTSCPSRRPTIQPSSHPSTNPTAKPSKFPSGQPSGRPSSRPSGQPTVIPSAQPSAKPTGQPTSSKPSSQPSSSPSNRPTGSPIRKGVTKTSRPSVAPTPAPSGRPTSAPSAAPTLSLTAQWSVRQKDLLEEVSSQITSSSVTYSDVVVIGSGVEMYAQTCSNWNKFYTNVQAAAVSKQLMKLTLAQSLGLNVPTTFFTCDGANPLTTLQDASVNGSVVSVSCGGGTWSVGSCSEHFALCVNCSQADITTCYANSFNSCSGADSNSSCLVRADTISGRYASYARVLIATFAVVVPAIEIVTVTDTKRLSVTLSVELDQYGAAYCAAFALSATPTAIQQITSLGHMAWAADDAVNITVTGLSAVTNYNIYCVAMSKQGQFSDISVAIANRQLVKTPCCKTLSFALITRDVYQDTLMAAVATLSSSSLPTSDLTVSFNAICRSDSKVYVGSILFPMTVTLGLSSPTASAIAFNGASSGKCNISAVLSGTDASDFEIVFTNGCVLRVLGSQSVPATPSISSAQFSSDGSSIVVKFDSQTDKGRVASVNNYICSVLFVFSGASQAKCQWNVDATTVTITLSSNYPLVVGAQISVAANKIRAACPTTHNSSTCERWPSVSSSSVSVVSPSRPTVPTVHITSPSTVGSCDHLSLDIGSSTGSGGRVWTTANYTCHHRDFWLLFSSSQAHASLII